MKLPSKEDVVFLTVMYIFAAYYCVKDFFLSLITPNEKEREYEKWKKENLEEYNRIRHLVDD